MSVYFIAVVRKVRDIAGMLEYARLAAPTIEQFGGKHIAAALGGDGLKEAVNRATGGKINPKPVAIIEGDPAVAVGATLLEFESKQAFEKWYYSPEYQAALKYRLASADVDVLLAEGH